MRGDVDRAQRLSARGIEGNDLVSGAEPDVLAVIRHAIHLVGIRKRAIFTNNLRG